MPLSLSQRLLPALQLTRMALVFTAIADSFCAALLLHAGDPSAGLLAPWRLGCIALISIGLYGYGMSLNDIIDRRRDQQVAANRPLPSGRIGVVAAQVICVALAGVALFGGIYLAQWSGRTMTLVLVVWTGLLIGFYDFAGKYLVAPGLLSLGLIRFFHALFPAPGLPLLWHPLLLLNHVTILSTVAYRWEQKRPPLTRIHYCTVFGGLACVDLLAIATVAWRRGWAELSPFAGARQPWLAGLPLLAAGVYVAIALAMRRRSPTDRDAGQAAMLYGLLWLIVYDAAFAAAYVNWIAAGALLLLLPLAWWSVRLMRWWSKLIAMTQRPGFKRAES